MCTERKESKKERGRGTGREEDLQTQIIHSNGEFSHRSKKERTPTQTFSENKGRRNTFHLIS